VAMSCAPSAAVRWHRWCFRISPVVPHRKNRV
jgi:hypothetical protein